MRGLSSSLWLPVRPAGVRSILYNPQGSSHLSSGFPTTICLFLDTVPVTQAQCIPNSAYLELSSSLVLSLLSHRDGHLDRTSLVIGWEIKHLHQSWLPSRLALQVLYVIIHLPDVPFMTTPLFTHQMCPPGCCVAHLFQMNIYPDTLPNPALPSVQVKPVRTS